MTGGIGIKQSKWVWGTVSSRCLQQRYGWTVKTVVRAVVEEGATLVAVGFQLLALCFLFRWLGVMVAATHAVGWAGQVQARQRHDFCME